MAGDSIKFNASLNTAGFESGAKKLQGVAAGAASGISQHFGKIAMAVAGITAAFIGVRAAAQSFNAAIAMGGQLNDLSARTGETAGNLAILQRAFQNAGAGAEAVGPTINRLQRAIVEAGEGSKTYATAFQKLGLDLNDLKTKTPTEQLRAVAEAIKGIENPSEQTAIAMQILGRSGGELMPLLKAMGIEFDRAGQQLGSLPGIIDRTNEHLDRIGDNFKAIGDKGKEFMVGLLERLAPGLADLTDRLANIDAAGFGAKLSEYAEKTVSWIAETFKLNDAISNLETAIGGITSGNFGDGLKLMFLTARDTALNAINNIVAAASAALETVASALVKLFDPSSTTMAFILGGFRMIAGKISESILSSIATVLEKIPFMGAAAAAVREAEKEAKQAVQDISNIMYYEADNLKKEWGGIMSNMPKEFADSYKANMERPLFDMKDRAAETAEQMERVAAATRAAAFDAEKFGEALRSAQVDRLAGMGGFNPLGGPAETGETGMGQNPNERKFPWQGAGPSGPQGGTTSRGGGGGGGGGGSSALRPTMSNLDRLRQAAQTDPRARAELMRLQNEQSRGTARAGDLRQQGMLNSAASAEIRAERRAEERADRIGARNAATDQFGGSNMGEAFRNYRDQMARAGEKAVSERDFKAWAEDQAKTERQREDAEAADGGGGGGGAPPGSSSAASTPATEGTLQKILTKIQERPILVA
jgi:hypothetical protein